ncbi:MAG: iron-containing alcohol dehydrogenase [Pseudomonadales bacterium]
MNSETIRPTTITQTATESVTLGRPAGETLAELARSRDAKRVFILASSTLSRETDEVTRIADALGGRHVMTWEGIRPHVPRLDVIAATEAARSGAADLIVTVGGGSVTDAGKAVAFCLQNGIADASQFDDYRIRVSGDGAWQKSDFADPDVRVICVPTTLSGGEFSPLTGVTDERVGQKHGYMQRSLAPVHVVLDPAITVHTPEWLWMSTGIRSVDHATETLASLQSNDFCDGMAESALRRLSEGLSRVKSDPGDMAARLMCQIGAWQSKIPSISGVPMGASHAIGHVLGGTFGVPHGYTSCVMAPYVQAWNAKVVARRQARISASLGAASAPAAVLLDELIRKLGMPRTLREVGVGREHFQRIAEYTLEDMWGKTNPRELRSTDDVIEILEAALG